MRVRFARGKYTIMTGHTVFHDAVMIEGCRQEAGGDMAGTAIPVRRHMVRRWRFASCRNAIVARCAIIHDACVIEAGTDKGRGVMAYGAIFRCRQMG